MRKSLTALSAMTVAGISLASSAFSEVSPLPRSTGPKKRNNQRNRSKPIGRYAIRRSGAQYPEQSSRQEMRAHRRAQGGRGIELVTGPTGFVSYAPKPYYF